MKHIGISLLVGLVFEMAPGVFGQTQIDLKTQGHNLDFSAAAATKPVKTGSALPASCGTGEMYMRLDAPAGQNLYACTAINTWTMIGSSSSGSGGASQVAQLQDFFVERTSDTVLTINSHCSVSAPCNLRLGALVLPFTSAIQATLTGGGTGVVRIYLSVTGELTLGYGAGLSISCTAGCSVRSGVTDFPSEAIPLFTWGIGTSGRWDAAGSDQRSLLANIPVLAGRGLTKTVNVANGATTLALDDAVVGTRTSPPATSTSSCTPNQWSSDTSYLYLCVAPGVWRRAPVATW
jgi:hypothetical protein